MRKKILKPGRVKRGGEQGNSELTERLGKSPFTESGRLFTGICQSLGIKIMGLHIALYE